MFTSILLFFGGIGTSEVVLILAVLLLFFGAKRIPDIARGLGRGIREFKDATNDIKRQIEEGDAEAPAPTVRRPSAEGVKDQA
jgi:sec-independent protein translocase protein TatA